MRAWLKSLTLEKCAALVTVIGFPLLLVSLFYGYRLDDHIVVQVSELRRIAQSQNSIALNQMFFGNEHNLGIIDAIEHKKPILDTAGGSFSSTQLDKYLGDLETVYDVYDEGLLSIVELCGSFSAYAQEAEGSEEVQRYLKQPENSNYFDGLPKLFDVVDHSKADGCGPP